MIKRRKEKLKAKLIGEIKEAIVGLSVGFILVK